MRVALLIGCCLLVALGAPAQVVWEKTWGGPYDDGCEVRNTRDGGMVAMASRGIHSWLMRLDANGDTLWTRTITQPYDLCAVTETYDGGFLATGTTRYSHRDLVAWKFGVHGDSLWLRIYPDSSFIEGMYSVIQRPDSGFIVSGYTSANGYDMLVKRLDSQGNEMWTKHYGGPDFDGGTFAAPTTDGGYVLSTTTTLPQGSAIWTVKVDALGDTVWTHTVAEPYPTGGPVPTVASDGKVWVIGWMNHGGDFNNYVLCLDSSGSEIWHREYLGIGFESRSARGIIEDRFGGFSFASSIDHAYGPVAGHDIALFRVDSMGAVTHIHRLGGNADDMPRYFEQAPNGDYLFIGFSASFTPNGQQTYMARLSPSGCGEFLYDFDPTLHHRVCPGDTLILDAGAGFASYVWSDGDTHRVRAVAQSDTLYATATDTSGCLHYSNAVVVEILDMPSFTWQQTSNLTLQFDGSADTAHSIVWNFGDGATDSLADPSHEYPAPGAYLACLTVAVDTCVPVTLCDTVYVTGATSLASDQNPEIKVFPHPCQDHAWIRHPSQASIRYWLRDAMGSRVAGGEGNHEGLTLVDVSRLSPGVYFLEMVADGVAVSLQKLVVVR